MLAADAPEAVAALKPWRGMRKVRIVGAMIHCMPYFGFPRV
jgi:hypothetical protein